MIRSNSFALFTGDHATERAAEATGRVRRFRDRILVDTGGGFEEPNGRRIPESRRVIVSLTVGQENDLSLPVVHGFLAGTGRGGRVAPQLPSGEFAMIVEGRAAEGKEEERNTKKEEDGLLLARDVLGTRPLFSHERDVASDHRFLPPGSRLLDPGATYSLSGGLRVRTKRGLVVPRDANLWSLSEASERLSDLLVNAVRDCVAGHARVAVSFSGGLDSAIVAFVASRFAEVTLYSVHAAGSQDERTCEQAAALLDLELRSSSVGEKEVAQELRDLSLPFTPSQMDKALWCIYSTAARLSRQNGAEVILLGQLADELFGGYLKYSEELEAKGEADAAEMMRRDVLACAGRGFIRDEAACGTWTEPRFPFANEELAAFALGLSVGYKISDGEGRRRSGSSTRRRRKVILREAASRLGLPEQLTESPKKAAQYSSGVLKQVAKLSLV